MAALTPKQRKLLDFIRSAIEHDGSAPTFDQMARGMGVKSKSDIHRQLKGLEERGAIRRMPNRMRAIEVVETAPEFPRTSIVGGEEMTVWFESRIADDKFGVVSVKVWPEGLEFWAGGQCRWRSWTI